MHRADLRCDPCWENVTENNRQNCTLPWSVHVRPVKTTVFRITRLILILRIRIKILILIHFVKFGKLTMISIHFVKFGIFTLISICFINSRINTSILIHITRKLEILPGLILWLLYPNFGYNSLKPHNTGMNNALQDQDRIYYRDNRMLQESNLMFLRDIYLHKTKNI